MTTCCGLCRPWTVRQEPCVYRGFKVTPPIFPSPPIRPQVVAAVGDRLLSLFDAVTEYDLGRTMLARRGGAAAWPPLDCCYFVHPTHTQALTTELPAGAKLKREARVSRSGAGRACLPGWGTLTVSHILIFFLHAQVLLLVRAGGKGYLNERNGAVAVSFVTPLKICGHVFFAPK